MKRSRSKTNYDYLLGMSKGAILDELGEGFNFYPDEVWSYDLKRSWWERRRLLLLEFENNILKGISVKRYYFVLW